MEVEIEITWSERFRVAKLIVPSISREPTRFDGVAVGTLERPRDGSERPFCDWTMDKSGFGIVSPDCFGFDGSRDETRLTLMRSPVYAWHDPTPLTAAEGLRYTDQGTHQFHFRFVPGSNAKVLGRHAAAMHAPPVTFDWTKGMVGPWSKA